MSINDDLFGDEWDEFESELIEEEFTEDKPKPKMKRIFRSILILTVIAVVMMMTAIVLNLREKESKDESNQWLSDTKTVAIAYREQLTNEAMDCAALQDGDVFAIPDVPDWADPVDTDDEDLKTVYGFMTEAQTKLTGARTRMLGICGQAESQPNSNWPPNTIPLPQIDGALVDIANAETLLDK